MGGRKVGTTPGSMGYPGNPLWPGITSPDGHPDCYYCSWAFHGVRGRMEVKYVNAACPDRRHTSASASG